MANRLGKTYLFLGVFSLSCIILGAYVPEEPGSLYKIAHLSLIHIGVGIWVACLVATTFDKLYHNEIIGEPLRAIKEELSSTKTDLDNFRGRLDALSQEMLASTKNVLDTFGTELDDFSRVMLSSTESDLKNFKEKLDELSHVILMHNNILKMSKQAGIVAIHDRKTEEFQTAVKRAVVNANEFIYTLGRTHRTMLIEEGAFDGWLMPVLLEHIHQSPDIFLSVILANTYEEDTGYRRQVKHLPERGMPSYMHSRYTARGLIQKVDEESLHKISIRLLKEAPPYAVLLTENKLFIEHYLPSQRGGQLLVFEIDRVITPTEAKEKETNTGLYDILLEDYKFLYKQSECLSDVLKKYLKDNLDLRENDEFGELEQIIEKAEKIVNSRGL